MTAPLACTRCGAAYEPVGANHTHEGLCPRCLAAPVTVEMHLENLRIGIAQVEKLPALLRPAGLRGVIRGMSITLGMGDPEARDAAEALARGGR